MNLNVGPVTKCVKGVLLASGIANGLVRCQGCREFL